MTIHHLNDEDMGRLILLLNDADKLRKVLNSFRDRGKDEPQSGTWVEIIKLLLNNMKENINFVLK